MIAAMGGGALLACARPESATAAAPYAPNLEIVFRSPQPAGNIGFAPDGAMIFSHHPAFEPEVSVVRLAPGATRPEPFPNGRWNARNGAPAERLDAVLGVRGYDDGLIWMLDMGTRSRITPKLIAWNGRTNRLQRSYPICPPASPAFSQLNDFAIDRVHGFAYIADEAIGPGGDGSRGAIVVVDLRTGASRRRLEGHVSTRAEDVPIVVEGVELKAGTPPVRLRIGADGIVADHRFEWLYYGPLNGRALYRVRVVDLINPSLDDDALGRRVERHSDKPNNGGLAIDRDDNVYLTEVEANAVGVIPAGTRRYRRLATHPELNWPDGVGFGPDGFLYVAAAQVHRAAPFNGGRAMNRPPYPIFRLRPLAPGRVGF